MADDQLSWNDLLAPLQMSKKTDVGSSLETSSATTGAYQKKTSAQKAKTKSKEFKLDSPSDVKTSTEIKSSGQDTWQSLQSPLALSNSLVSSTTSSLESHTDVGKGQSGVPAEKAEPSASAAAPIPSNEPEVFSIFEINKLIKQKLEGDFATVWIKGEISNFKPHTSGHFYFSLKDDKAQINAVMFKGHNSRLTFRPENGMEVLVRGRITVYEPRGTYQIFCELMEPVGAGAMQRAFEELKRKLQAEGLFDSSRKRELPKFPKHIAIVTSPTGAAIRDMLNVLSRRYKGAHITVLPCKVQGDQAPAEIIQAIGQIKFLPQVDVAIIGRGGGSIEDLWAFNDERVARAIAFCSVPTISAVGHEIDFTIADFVADLRAPTPSAAAELVAKNSVEVVEKIRRQERGLFLAMKNSQSHKRQSLRLLENRLIDPRRVLQDLALRNDELMARLEKALRVLFLKKSQKVHLAQAKIKTPREILDRKAKQLGQAEKDLHWFIVKNLERAKTRVAGAVGMLEALSPLKVVSRGYSLVTKKNGELVKSVRQIEEDEELRVQLAEGTIHARVTSSGTY